MEEQQVEQKEPIIINCFRELDMLVAEHVMGWTELSRIRWTDENGEQYETPILHGKPYGNTIKQNVPNYSTDPRDAGDIISLLEGSCWIQVTMEPDINDASDKKYTDVLITYLDIQDYGADLKSYTTGTQYSSRSESYPLSLCLSALKMVLDNTNISFIP